MVDIMVVASPKSFIDPYLEQIKKAGFHPSLIDSEPNALLWGVRNPFSAKASNEPIMIVNIGNANCGVNPTGGTASIGGAGTITLAPLGSYSPRIVTLFSSSIRKATPGRPRHVGASVELAIRR